DLFGALESFRCLGDRRWVARTDLSFVGLGRVRREWSAARQHLDEALQAFRTIGDRPAEARALRELGLLLRDQGDLPGAAGALDASRAIFDELGDALWVARVLAGQASLADARGTDSAALISEARQICRQRGIASEEKITTALREW